MNEYIRRQDVVEECGEWYVEEGTEEGFIGTVSQMLNMFLPADVVPKEPQEIGYDQCANAMLKMWMDNVVTDGEYNRIMDRLNKLHFSGGEKKE